MTSQEAIAELSEVKRELLAVSDLTWIWTHDVWGNKDRRTIVSQDWVKTHSVVEIKRALAQPARPAQWKHLFNTVPSETVLSRIIHELG